MNINEIPKFVLNLKARTDRLEKIKFEMEYVGWNYEVFNAVEENNYMGCALSHLAIIELAESRGYEKVMVIEDDCTFMPYANTLLKDLDSIENLNYGVLNLAPTLNRPVNVSGISKFLLDITNLPEKPHTFLTEIFATNILIYSSSVYDAVKSIRQNCFSNGTFVLPIDEHLVRNVYPNFQSYTPILPIAPQSNSYSDVSHGMYNNFYTQTYNWNQYSPIKIPHQFMNDSENMKIKLEKKYLNYNVS